MKKLLTLSLILIALVCAPILGGKVSVVSASDINQASQCQAGDNSKCVESSCDVASPTCKPTSSNPNPCEANKCNVVVKYLNPFIKLLSIFVGTAVIIGIVIGGIQYSSSAGDPQKVAVAKNRIKNSIIALLVFFFLWALLRFLIPGTGLLVG